MKCDDEFKKLVTTHLTKFSIRRAPADAGRCAAVALAIVDGAYGADLAGLAQYETWQSQAALVLTRRAHSLRNHPGQWALPGGRIDDGETVAAAALRELGEEVGIELKQEAILGQLDDFITRSGFVMTPLVVWVGPHHELIPNEAEVASIHRIPIAEFLRSDAPLLDHAAEGSSPILRMPVGSSWIAAPTAAILFQFREVCVYGRETRVAHYEQPQFARR